MTSLADEALLYVQRSGRPCGVAMLDPFVRAELEEALELGRTARSLSRALKNRGIELSDGMIARHRRGDCSC